jgi:hypothetical protein
MAGAELTTGQSTRLPTKIPTKEGQAACATVATPPLWTARGMPPLFLHATARARCEVLSSRRSSLGVGGRCQENGKTSEDGPDYHSGTPQDRNGHRLSGALRTSASRTIWQMATGVLDLRFKGGSIHR